MFRIVFVIDIFKGIAVHAVRGERLKYQPFHGSKICTSSDPLEMITELKPHEVYIADLDRLQRIGENFETIEQITAITKTMVDIGVETKEDIVKCAGIADTVILGTETASLDLIERAVHSYPGRINVSIDIKSGKVLTKDRKMGKEPLELIRSMNEYDIKDIIILNLDKVGTGQGIDAELFCNIVRISKHNIMAGGGIRDMSDINILKDLGVGGALVATALHNGKIPLELIIEPCSE